MGIRGTVTLECDTKGCHAEYVMEAETTDVDNKRYGVVVRLPTTGWRFDDEQELFYCPDCCRRDEREKGDDDGREYGHPGDRLAGRE